MSEWYDKFPVATPVDMALHHEGATGDVAALARSIYQQESGSGANTKTSNAGAVGGMQVIPATFKRVADDGWDINDPVQNARAGVRYIKTLHAKAGGDSELTAAGYYGGEGAIDKARAGVAVADPRNPGAPNTLEYGKQVAARAGQPAAKPADGLDWLKAYPEATPEDIKAHGAKQAPAAAPAGQDWLKSIPAASPQEIAQAPAPAEPSMTDAALRSLGLGARAAVQGVAAVPGMLSDAVTGPINAGLDVVRGEGNGYRFPRASVALGNVMTAAGVPTPANAQERVMQDVMSGVAGVGSGAVAAGPLTRAAGAAASAVGRMFTQGVGTQAVSAAAGGAAAGVTREEGGSPTQQAVAGLAGGLAPVVAPYAGMAAVRGAVRGGETGRLQTAENIKTFADAAGTTPSLGQATQSRMVQGVESTLARVPGGSGPMHQFAARQADALGASVQQLAADLAPNANAITAGEAITRGVDAFKSAFKVKQAQMYRRLDEHLPSAAPMQVGRTREALAALNEGVDGADAVSKFFKNSRIGGIEGALLGDLEASAQKQLQPGGSLMNPAGPNMAAATLPYEAVKKLRTLVGKEIEDNSLVADVPRSKWRALYGALSDDLGVAAERAGPQAHAAWKEANDFTTQQLSRLDELSSIVKRDAPEKIFTAALSGTVEGGTVVGRVMAALPVEEKRHVAAAVLQRMGRATAGAQNELGDAFSTETFLTNLAKLSPDARGALFGGLGKPEIGKKLEIMGRMAANIRDGSKVFSNPSGTAQAMAQGAWISSLMGAVASGNPKAMATAIGAPIGARLVAKQVATNSGLVQAMGKETVMNSAAPAVAVEAAARTANTQPAPANPSQQAGEVPPVAAPPEPPQEVPPTPQAPEAAAPAVQVAPATPPEPGPEGAPPAGEAAAPAIEPVRPTQAPEPDIVNRLGKPFTVRLPAIKAAEKAGPGYAVVPVEGGFVVRKMEASNVQNPQTAAAPEAAPTETTAAVGGDAAPAAAPGAGGDTGVEAGGVTGEPINKEWTAFAPESGTLGIPRAEMPQIKAAHRGAMTNFLNARGIAHEQVDIPAGELKPTQAEFSPGKVQNARDFNDTDRSILVSSDGHVLDGHHQWLAKRDSGEPVKAIRLDAPIAQLLAHVREFPSAQAADGATKTAEATPPEPEAERPPTQAEKWKAKRMAYLRIQPEDVLNSRGHPFTVKQAADRAAKAAGEGYAVAKVPTGYVVRRSEAA